MTSQVYWVPSPWPGRIGILPRPRGGDWLGDDVRAWRLAGLDTVVSLLTPDEESELGLDDEEVRAKAEGLAFYRLATPDRGVPPSRTVAEELIARLRAALEQGKSVGVHCRQGIGRSGLLLASLLVAAGQTPDEAFRTIAASRGVTVPETDEQRRWVAVTALDLSFAKAHTA